MITTVDQAIQVAKDECKDPYALQYINAIPRAIDSYGSEGFDSQLLYALANMQHWCGENARQAKAVMRDYLKKRKML